MGVDRSGQLKRFRNELVEAIEANKDKELDFFLNLEDFPIRLLRKFVVLNEMKKSSVEETDRTSIDELFRKPGLIEEMVMADGPTGGNYGKAFEIYQDIEKEMSDKKRGHPVLHRLAVAVALVHATPVIQTNPKEVDQTDEDGEHKFVDPVRRYLNYETAYFDGELDPNFAKLNIWELKFVVDGDEPDEIAMWGRQTLKNYYPNHVLDSINNPKNSFLYAMIVRTDIPYGSSRVSQDLDTNQKYQNVLMNGGICGRRAFFGRFILRSFGIPTTARPSKGHAALCHYQPDGYDWEINLGNRWGKGWTKTRYVKDLDFLYMTQARCYPKEYAKVQVARMIGDVMDEKPVYGIYDPNVKGRGQNDEVKLFDPNGVAGYWYSRSLQYQQETIIGKCRKGFPKNAPNFKARTGPNPPKTVAENTKEQKQQSKPYKVVGNNTIVRIPAGSFTDPKHTKDVKVMKSFTTEEDTGDNQQIYLPSFSPEGTTILRGGTWKDVAGGHCNSGSRLLSGGKGRYSDWGFRVAMTMDGDDDESSSCPEPTITLLLNDDDDDSAAVKIEFVHIPPGQFVMGWRNTEDGRFSCVEKPHHTVRITRGFYMGKFQVTQQQYELLTGKNPSKSTKEPNCPVDNVGIDETLRFCQIASDRTGRDIRLPTEAEWEYSARGTTNGKSPMEPKWFWGNDPSKLPEYAWCKHNSEEKSHPVGLLKPNPFGLYDIYGNVTERISDTYKREYYEECSKMDCCDPKGPSQGMKSKYRYEKIPIPQDGDYSLTAKICTVTNNQKLNVSLQPCDKDGNADGEVFTMDVPYTIGEWKESDPIILKNLKKGNGTTLHFWRDKPPQYGISVKEFTLTKIE